MIHRKSSISKKNTFSRSYNISQGIFIIWPLDLDKDEANHDDLIYIFDDRNVTPRQSITFALPTKRFIERIAYWFVHLNLIYVYLQYQLLYSCKLWKLRGQCILISAFLRNKQMLNIRSAFQVCSKLHCYSYCIRRNLIWRYGIP